ncbi:hypothetical protein [uncultured Bradyrhizobium sp.]|uniref:hypothetical protein n=1 Tax=uncultured Bradyrhizobium sp. TaxID=199684 RepID=UPI0035CB5276
MPVLRYFLTMGCCLLALLFTAAYLMPQGESFPPKPEPAAAQSESGGSLASWRKSQQNLSKSQSAAVVYPDIAPMAPTADRLQFERQMTFRTPDSAALEARAELPAAVEAAAPPAMPAKSAAKPSSRTKNVARAERRDRPNYAAAYPPAPAAQFGGYRQAQFDRSSGGFFGFRMF